jgi:DNA polymerase III delta prime subunit
MESIEYDKTYATLSASNKSSATDDDNQNAQKTDNLIHESGRLQLNTYQAFIQNLMNPRSDIRSLLLVHMTGTGKTITALATATEYVKQYSSAEGNNSVSSIIVLGFTKDIFKKELLAHPEFNFVNADEAKLLKDLESRMNDSPVIAEQYQNRKRLYYRRLIKREVKGIYQFYGYRQFAGRVLNMDDIQSMIKKTRKAVVDETEDLEEFDPKLISKWIENGDVRINYPFIETLSKSLVICDEVHNLYKNDCLNTYGVAIKVVFDYFYKDPSSSYYGCMRSLLLSATPLTASALEIIPICALLTGDELKYKDLFKAENGIDKLTSTGLSKIKSIISGRISYIMDDNPKEYPSSSFAGSAIGGINYLKFIRCKPTGHQLKYFSNWNQRLTNSTDEKGSNMCKDIILPSTDKYPLGVVFSKNMNLLADLPSSKALYKSADGMMTSNIFRISELPQYSTKYAKLVQMCIDMKAKEFGKLFIYHPFVQGAGTDMISSILRSNGFVMEGDVPVKDSICMECDIPFGSHKKSNHDFTPIVFITINGTLSKQTISNRLNAYNNQNNIFGEKIKIVVGSRAMRESHTLKACKHIIITHEPSSISEMVQIIGRAVRKNVHAMLPAGMRSVQIHILTTDISSIKSAQSDAVANEELSYKLKILQYTQINYIERIMYDTAIDYLINFRFKLRETPPLLGESYPLDRDAYAKYEKVLTRAYSSLRNGNGLQGLHTNRFNLFYLQNEAHLVSMIIKRILLDYQPMLTLKQLKPYIREPPFHIEYNTQLISDEAIAMAIQKISFSQDQMRIVSQDSTQTLVDTLFDQTSTILDHDGNQCKIICIGDPLCEESYLTIKAKSSIAEGDQSIIDSFRRTYTMNTNVPIDMKSILNIWAASIDIDDLLSEIKSGLKVGSRITNQDDMESVNKIAKIVSKFPIQSHIILVEWAITNAVEYAIHKKNVADIHLVKLITDYYRTTRLLIWITDLETTRVYDRYKKIDTTSGSPWWNKNAKQATGKLPIGHLLGDTIRLLQPMEMTWLDLANIGVGIQNKHPMGWYIYEEQIGQTLNVALKIKFEDATQSKGITLNFLQKTQLDEIAKKLKVNISKHDHKSITIEKIEAAAWELQAKLYPKRVIYQLIDI